MDIYIARNDNSAATVEDFFAAMQEAAPEIDLTQIMRWYAQAGTPEITFEESYDAAARKFTLTLRQHTNPTPGQPVKEAVPDPGGHRAARCGRQGSSSGDAGFQPGGTEIYFREHRLGSRCPRCSGISLRPIKLKGQTRERLAFLAAKDTDLFNRWDALQQYASIVLLEAVAAHQAGAAFKLDAGLRDAIAATLRGAERDPAFAAEALILPGETLLADQMDMVDPQAIHAVREAARRALG